MPGYAVVPASTAPYPSTSSSYHPHGLAPLVQVGRVLLRHHPVPDGVRGAVVLLVFVVGGAREVDGSGTAQSRRMVGREVPEIVL